MKIGDLVRHVPSSNVGLILEYDDCSRPLVKWCDDIGEIEDTDLYKGELEVINV